MTWSSACPEPDMSTGVFGLIKAPERSAPRSIFSKGEPSTTMGRERRPTNEKSEAQVEPESDVYISVDEERRFIG